MKASHFIAILALGSSLAAFAQQSPSATTSRANVNLESEGNARSSVSDISFDWVKEAGLFAHGNFAANHQVRLMDGQALHGVQVDIETRLFETCRDDSYYGGVNPEIMERSEDCDAGTEGTGNGRPRILFFPFEMTMRFNVDQVNDVDVQKIRQGVIRMMLGETGVNVQLASYLQRQYQGSRFASEDLIYRGAEIVSIGVNEAINIDENGHAQIVIRVNGGVGLGRVDNNFIDAAQVAREAVEATYDSRATTFGTNVSGSFGLRIYGRVLLEAFGGADIMRSRYVDANSFYYGGQVRAALVRNHLDLTVRAERTVLNGSALVPANTSTTITSGLQVHW